MPLPNLQDTLDLIDQGRAEELIPRLTAWAQQLPTHAAVRVALARAYEATAQWNAAHAAWQDAHFLMPNSPAIAEGLARAAASQDGPEDHLVMDLDLQAELDAMRTDGYGILRGVPKEALHLDELRFLGIQHALELVAVEPGSAAVGRSVQDLKLR